MTLIQAWIDSLSLLKLKHLKLFILVTLKSIVDTYKILLKYWWWLFGIIVACFIMSYHLTDSFIDYVWIKRISDWAYQILLFATIIATRPSLEQKNCAYFRFYMRYFLITALFLLIAPLWIWPRGLSVIYFFIILFYMDSIKRTTILKKTLHTGDLGISIFRAIKMIIYNYPLLLCIGLIIYIPLYFFAFLIFLYSSLIINYIYLSLLLNIIYALLSPIIVCLYTNIYIKKLHDQFDLYFTQPS